jgi:hypothetical protein
MSGTLRQNGRKDRRDEANDDEQEDACGKPRRRCENGDEPEDHDPYRNDGQACG